MPRKRRIQFEGAWYHAMNRGLNRMNIFYNDDQRKHFITLLEAITQKYDVQIHAFCLMNNHYHLAIHTPLGNLSEAIRYLNCQHTKYVNKQLCRTGPLFKGRYHACLMSEEKYLLRVVRYIHQNPLRAKMVTDLSHYKWSSYLSYIDIHSYDWLFLDEVNQRFVKLKYDHSFSHFMMNQDDTEISNFFKNLNFNSIIADTNTDIKTLGDFFKESRLTKNYLNSNDALKLYKPPEASLIIDITKFYFQIPTDELCTKNQIKRYNIPRRVAIYLLHNLGKATYSTIANIMGDLSIGGISSTLSRSRKNPEVLDHAEKIQNLILRCRKITF